MVPGRLPRIGRALHVVWLPRVRRRWERLWDRIVKTLHALELDENTILLGFAVVIGLLGAGGVIAFYRLIDFAYFAFARWPGTFLGRGDFLIYRPVLTAAGLALAWQGLWVGLILAFGAHLFRRRILQSGPAGGFWRRRPAA